MLQKSSTYIITVLIAFVSFSISGQTKKLKNIIETYESHKGYDRDKYPLGLYTEDYYKSEAEFAKTLLDKLSKIDQKKLIKIQIKGNCRFLCV